jgi:hypothetical protein
MFAEKITQLNEITFGKQLLFEIIISNPVVRSSL